MPYIAYLDEFGHIGPYVSRNDLRHNDSPVFGLAGIVLPLTEARGFGTWFYQRKCELLAFELNQSEEHPVTWEKKGSALYTAKNIEKYPELKKFTNRFLNKINKLNGFVFYVGIRKRESPEDHQPKNMYRKILSEAIKRLDQFCLDECNPPDSFILVMDEHVQRSEFITEASISMYNQQEPRRALIEPPFQVESHRYQTMQAADWIAGLVGRFGCAWKDGESFPEFQIFRRYFEHRLNQVSKRSGIRSENR